MIRRLLWLAVIGLVSGRMFGQSTFLGFDRNQYPGDENLKALRQTFAFAGYWLNDPPGETHQEWRGKRQAVESAGFGFLVLFNGRLYAQLKNEDNAAQMGKKDAAEAAASARREGFPGQTIIFLDQEEGGRMLPEQRAYIHAWVDGITAAGFRVGVYCSGMGAKEESGESIVTAVDIRQNAAGRKISYFVTKDACPPSPGCTFSQHPPRPAGSGVGFADIWQFAQSPKRPDITAACASSYSRDGECYAPGTKLHVDLDTATRADPSGGRTQ
jgi:hypothetical protein